MSAIVCAIRGGPYSEPTIRHAIGLAQETGLPVHFLYVVNLDFLSRTSSSRTATITQEMEQLGEFILLKACATAAEKNVTAHGDVRHGDVTAEIIKLCDEVQARYVVLGRPQMGPNENLFTLVRLAQFAELLATRTGATVEMTPQEPQ